jgi:hypothetical protein
MEGNLTYPVKALRSPLSIRGPHKAGIFSSSRPHAWLSRWPEIVRSTQYLRIPC